MPSVSNTPIAEHLVFVKHDVAPGQPTMAGAVIGTLEQRGNCLYIVSDARSEEWVPLWPPNFNLLAERPAVVSAVGGRPLTAGERVQFGGGGVDASVGDEAAILDNVLGGRLPPAECATSHYWIVSDIETP